MPIILAYSGEITLSATEKSNNSQNKFYDKTIKAYGETIGELLDNLVKASVSLAAEAFEWTLVNKSANYKMDNDYWYATYSHPDVLRNVIPSKSSDIEDTGGGSSVDSIEDIVRYSVLNRDIAISSVLTNLSLMKKEKKSSLPSKANVPYNGIYQSKDLKNMTQFGFSGSELDEIIRIAKEDGILALYENHSKIVEYAHARKVKTAKNASSKSRWWSNR